MDKILFTLLFGLCTLMIYGQNLVVPETQKSIVTKHTATWCPNCGTMPWDIFEGIVDEAGSNAIVIAAHRSRSSDLYSKTAEEFLLNMPGVIYQPEFFVNDDKMDGAYATLVAEVKAKVQENAKQSPEVQSAIELLVNEDGSGPLIINTNTKFFKNASGPYRIAVWLIEKGVEAEQASRGINVVHKQVLKKALTEETFGPEFANDDVDAGTEFQHNFEYEFEEGEEIENLEVAVTIWKFVGNRYVYVNGNSSSSFSTVTATSVNQLEGLLESFTISPNLIEQDARIDIQLKEDIVNAQLGLFNIHGQLVQTIFRGELLRGDNQFNLETSSLPASGLYFVSLRSREGVISKKVIVR